MTDAEDRIEKERNRADTRSVEAEALMKMTGKILPVFAIVVLLCIGACVFRFISASRDIPPPDTTDLIPERPDVSPEKNAYTYFLAATNSFYWPTNSAFVADYFDGKPADDTLIQELITRNTDAMKLIETGLRCEICLTPEVTSYDSLCPYLSQWRYMGKVMALNVRHDRLAGRYVEASDTCVSLLRFADMIQRNAEGIVHYFVGIVVTQVGLAQVRDLARDEHTPENELKRLAEVLSALSPFDRGLVRAIKVEYKVNANTIDHVPVDMVAGIFARDGLRTRDNAERSFMTEKLLAKLIASLYVFQPERTKLISAKLYRDMIANAPLRYADINLYDLEETLGLDNKRTRMIRPNVIGRMLCAFLTPAIRRALELKCRAESDVAATRVIVACNAYARTNGELPDSLQSLVPAYLPSVPADPYDGQPLRYSRSSAIIYSVGKDLKDSRGSVKLPAGEKQTSPLGPLPLWRAEDLVFEIRTRP